MVTLLGTVKYGAGAAIPMEVFALSSLLVCLFLGSLLGGAISVAAVGWRVFRWFLRRIRGRRVSDVL